MELLKAKYNQENYLNFLKERFDFDEFIKAESIDDIDDVQTFKQLGFITTADNIKLPVFEIYIKPNTKLERNRVQLRKIVAQKVDGNDGALAVYVDDKNDIWRFSFIAIEYMFGEEGMEKTETASKRFTYFFGEGAKIRTAENQFSKLNKQSTLTDLKEAFAVEGLNKEFYNKLYKWYEKAQNQVNFPNDEQSENHIQTGLIRFLTRMLFVWFLKEKKLINADLFDKDKLKILIDYEKTSSIYKAILQNLFFATLNRQIIDRSFRTTTNGKANATNYLAGNIYRYQNYFKYNGKQSIMALFEQTPFLNGGLFECLDHEATDKEKKAYKKDTKIRPVESAIRIDGFSDKANNELKFDNQLLFNDDEQDLGLFDLLGQYQFTVEESTPQDVEVALDPELLGKVFENLLATYNPETGDQARKATGSFYTPREIVSYMVDESLKQHFKTHTNLEHDVINDLFIEGENTLKELQTKKVIEAIDSLKILDPAVGSGAYPMGVLQKLVFILEKIDSENTVFKQQQLVKTESMDGESKKASIVAIEQVFSKENQYNAYGKKLMLIENSIYGVDIQPIAIQICKLRFFISLTVEQKPNKDKNDNYGIKALPNLETKFIVANTLLPLGKTPPQAGLFDTDIDNLQKQLAQIRHNYFNAKTLKTKRKYRNEDESVRVSMLGTLKQTGITPAVETSMKKVVAWDLYNQNSVSNWFDPEWMFGVKKGFGIVIGNPPYIQLQKDGGNLGKLHKENGFEVFAAAGDVYQLFYEQGCKLLNASGVLTYITSNSWLKANYGKLLRNYFYTNHTVLQLIEMGKGVFESAIVDSNILLLSNGYSGNLAKAVDMDCLKDKTFPPVDKLWGNLYSKNEKPWSILSTAEQSIMNKMETMGTPLIDWDIRINYGIKTGFNEAFIIDNDTKQALCQQDPKSTEIIKPVLKGRNIQRYQAEWGKLWLIYTRKGINIKQYSAVYQHLLKHKENLSKKAGNNQWYELQASPSDELDMQFSKEKIIWIELTDGARFSYDNSGIHCEATTFMMTGVNLKYILAILNSNLIYWFFNNTAPTSGMGTLRWKKIYINMIPIPKVLNTEQQPFIDLINKVLVCKKQNKGINLIDKEINQLVYDLYQLSESEIKLISSSVIL
ncbi:MAG: hypothetical protein FE834_05360 [Gammaproteobacteria bacterium]|nr:hypothetical protein [Gammaproteobacteria bacterium]